MSDSNWFCSRPTIIYDLSQLHVEIAQCLSTFYARTFRQSLFTYYYIGATIFTFHKKVLNFVCRFIGLLDLPQRGHIMSRLHIAQSSGVQRLLDARCNRPDHTRGRSIPGYIMAWANLYLWIYYGRGQFISSQAIIYPGDKLAHAIIYPGII